jgi:2,5-diamino-6-(ribosylamino)-4(3H)-pyrimidinone 5'-phosphate reductase
MAHHPPRPHVALNFAISADGKISTRAGIPSGWTSAEDFERFLQLRLSADALLVGRGTLEADRMSLTIPPRLGPARQPLRCVVSGSGRLNPEHTLFSTPGGPIHLLVSNPSPDFDPTFWQGKGVHLHAGTLAEFLQTLRRDCGVERILCEGGGTLVRALAELDAIDEIHLTWAGHTLFGGHDAPSLSGRPGDHLRHSLGFELVNFEPAPQTGECFLTYRRSAPAH